MGYYILQRPTGIPFDLSAATAEEVVRWGERLEAGSSLERRQALRHLVAAGAEGELTRCLASQTPEVVQLAAEGLWTCWLAEAGPAARESMDKGVELMSRGQLQKAARVFEKLSEQHPGWAEPVNKLATVLYMVGQPHQSLTLCQQVVAMKPDHFGAWNGMALCAIQIEDWEVAHRAVHESLRLQPYSAVNQQLLGLVRSRLPQV